MEGLVSLMACVRESRVEVLEARVEVQEARVEVCEARVDGVCGDARSGYAVQGGVREAFKSTKKGEAYQLLGWPNAILDVRDIFLTWIIS